MIPTKVRDLIPEVAEMIGIPKDDLSAMISFYYKEEKRMLSRLEHLHLVIRGLGNMTIKGWNINKEIDRIKKKLEKEDNPEDRQYLLEEIDTFNKILVKWEEQETKKKEAKLIKRQYYENKRINDTERKATDSLEQ